MSTAGPEDGGVETELQHVLVAGTVPVPADRGAVPGPVGDPGRMLSERLEALATDWTPTDAATPAPSLAVHTDGPHYTVLPPVCPSCGAHLQFEPPSFTDVTTVTVPVVCPRCETSGTGIFQLQDLRLAATPETTPASVVAQGEARPVFRRY